MRDISRRRFKNIKSINCPCKLNEIVPFTEFELYLVSLLEYRLKDFNPSFLEGINDPKQIVAFGAPFFRIFKAAYPSLRRVRLSKREIVDLSLIASGWFMHTDEETKRDTDIFLAKCLKIYFPEYSDTLPKFNISMAYLYRTDSLVAFEAACQLHVKRIPSRNFFISDISPSESVDYFFNNEPIFLKLFTLIPNINDAETNFNDDRHILFQIIKKGRFYPELMLRPELKEYRISYNDQVNFQDFYSEALFLAICYKNIEAIHFLLNLDYSYYQLTPPQEIDSDSEFEPNSDSESELSDATFHELVHPNPISLHTFASLKAIFLSETIEEVLDAVPDVFKFSFCNWSIKILIGAYKNNFTSMMLLNARYNALIEEKYREKLPLISSGQKRQLDRSSSPTIYEKPRKTDS